MPEQVQNIIKEASLEEKKQEKRKRLLEKMGICIESQKLLEERIKKLITTYGIN